jgi:hypothetical protein
VPLEEIATLPERVQELLGLNITPRFIGHAEGQHPRQILEYGGRSGGSLASAGHLKGEPAESTNSGLTRLRSPWCDFVTPSAPMLRPTRLRLKRSMPPTS